MLESGGPIALIVSEVASHPLTILLFGPMQVLVHGRPLPRMRSRKALWLLALLTLRDGKPVEREWLAGTLWPDVTQERAATNLRVVLSEMRHALGSEGGRLQSPGRHTLSLDLAGADVDLLTFDAAVHNKKLEALQQAVALYRGPLLEDCAEEWVGQERNVREQNCLLALQTLADTALAAGNYAAAAASYRRAMGMDPWGEATLRGLMEALAKSGDRNAALHVYRQHTEFLRSDPGAVPDEETRVLYARLRAEARQGSRTQTASTAEQSVLSEAAPLRVSGYLPHPLTDLIGREKERIEVLAKLRGSRLVTLTGPGGIGKTRLAIEVATEGVQDGVAYPDGVWLVSLESLSEGQQVVPQFAAVLALREEPGRLLLDQLIEHLRTKRLLLVLDNCEHLMEASAHVVSRLLRECARVRTLATSREALGLIGEVVLPMPSLAVPDPKRLSAGSPPLQAFADYESIQLFVERAQERQKGFELTQGNALAVAQVCFQLEGVPLAIELAAARVHAMTVEQIAARLNDHLSLLTTGNRAALARQQTLRTTLEWSYHLLTEPERLLLQRLSVFVGGWTLEAAEAICAGEGIAAREVLDLLTTLVNKSLVMFIEQESERQTTGARYRLLEMVRQYAAEQLQADGKTERFKTRHLEWCCDRVQEAELGLKGPDQKLWLLHMDVEHDNLRAAITWEPQDTNSKEMVLRLAGFMWRYWFLRGHFTEGRRYLGRVIQRAGDQFAPGLLARALSGAGSLAFAQGDYAAARGLNLQSLELKRQLDDPSKIAGSLDSLGHIAHVEGDYALAQAYYEQSVSLYQESGNRFATAAVLNNLAQNMMQLGNLIYARQLLTESLAIDRELGNRIGMAASLDSLGIVAEGQGNYEEALGFQEESIRLWRELKNPRGLLYALSTKAYTHYSLEDYDAVRRLQSESLELSREIGDRRGEAWSLNRIGEAEIAQREYASGHAKIEKSLSLMRELGDRRGIAIALRGLGHAAYAQGDNVLAQSFFQESLRGVRDLGSKSDTAPLLEEMASVHMGLQQIEKAARLWAAAASLRVVLGFPMSPGESRHLDNGLPQARSALGNEAFDAAWEEGCSMNWEKAVEYALEPN